MMSDAKSENKRPKGSGWFSLIIGGFSIAAAVFSHPLAHVCRETLFGAWLALSGFALAYWGAVRVGWLQPKWMIGQGTIGMAAGALAVTFTIWTLVLPNPEDKVCSIPLVDRVARSLTVRAP